MVVTVEVIGVDAVVALVSLEDADVGVAVEADVVEVNGADVVVEAGVLEGMEEGRGVVDVNGVLEAAVELNVDGVVTLVVRLEIALY